MKPSWIKFIYERNTYVVDLDCISAFACTEKGRLIFWLPDSKVQVIIHPKTHPEVYKKILEYIKNKTGQSLFN